jgi:ABC-2 type transport system permease protein
MVWKARSGKYVKFFTYLIVIVLINAAGITLFFRWDLTENRIYSISEASKKVVSTLSEPLTINVFFTKNLPAPHNNTERYLHDLLEEYAIYANKYFNYRFYDVSPEEGGISADTRENQKMANNYGIHPIQIQVIEKDEVKFQRAYMGLVIIHGDLIERIATIPSTQGLEYKLTTAIQKLNNKISALLSLSDKIQVKLFLSASLETVARYIGLRNLPKIPQKVQEIVTKLNQTNYDRLNFEFLNPSEEKDVDEVSNTYNIMTLKWPELPKVNIPAGRGAIGLVMQYRDKALTIPLMQVIRIPLIGTQYKLMDMGQMEEIINNNVDTLIDINEDLGILSDHGTLSVSGTTPFEQTIQQQNTLSNFRGLMSQNYTLKNINLKDDAIPEGLNCLVVVRPTEKFSDYELYQIDQFLMQGKSLFLILDSFNEVMPSNQQDLNISGRGPSYIPLSTGLEKLLEHYGIRIKKSYVMDENCFRQQLPARLGGGEKSIYFAPLIKKQFINNELEFMKTIKALVAFKISPLEPITERIQKNGLNAHKLFASSQKSWEMRGRINLNPLFIQPPPPADERQSQPLAYLLEGEFPSYFEGKPIPIKEAEEKQSDKQKDQETSEEKTAKTQSSQQSNADQSADTQADIDVSQIINEGQFMPKSKPAKIFIMASSEMLKDNILDASGRGSNATLIMNVVDYLNDQEDIAVMRGKEQRFNPLDDTTAAAKTFVKTFNIAGLPILVVFFGLVVWFHRHTRKKHIQMMFQK